MTSPTPSSARDGRSRFTWAFKLLPLLLLAAGLAGAVILVKTRPRPERKPPPPIEALVRVIQPEAARHTIRVKAMGTVVPAREVQLKAQVSGEVVWVHPSFQEGGFFREGETLLRIDRRDYELAHERAKARMQKADFEYQLEAGRQDVARREYELIQGDRPASERVKSLALRQPHLQNVQAGLALAQADLDQAALNLERTEIRAPFSALLRARHTEEGAVISPQEPLATLVGTDTYWVRVTLPIDRLASLQMAPGVTPSALTARVSLGRTGATWSGKVVRLLGDLEENGRMARVLVEIPKPLEQGKDAFMLLLGSYVHVEIEGKILEQAVVLPRTVLREGDTLWLMDEERKLEIRPVTVAWRDVDAVYLTGGLKEGDRVVASDLALPVPGMPLLAEGEQRPEPEPEANAT